MTTNTTKIAIAKDYLALTKPRVTWLIMVTTAVGYFFGAPRGPWDGATILRLAHTLTGTALLASATAVLNEWYERESDAKMRRTSRRPLPAGRIEPTYALIFGIVLEYLVRQSWSGRLICEQRSLVLRPSVPISSYIRR